MSVQWRIGFLRLDVIDRGPADGVALAEIQLLVTARGVVDNEGDVDREVFHPCVYLRSGHQGCDNYSVNPNEAAIMVGSGELRWAS